MIYFAVARPDGTLICTGACSPADLVYQAQAPNVVLGPFETLPEVDGAPLSDALHRWSFAAEAFEPIS